MNLDETYAQATTMDTLQLVLALSTQFGLTIQQMDAGTVFLNAMLNEEMYIKPTVEIEVPAESKCVRLIKALYGLKQSPRP